MLWVAFTTADNDSNILYCTSESGYSWDQNMPLQYLGANVPSGNAPAMTVSTASSALPTPTPTPTTT
jgi:hypothetical protein